MVWGARLRARDARWQITARWLPPVGARRVPDGLAVACLLRGTSDPPRVLLTSGEVDAVPDDVLARSGAAGFVAKTELAVTDLAPYLGS